jgi:hypothetical protein
MKALIAITLFMGLTRFASADDDVVFNELLETKDMKIKSIVDGKRICVVADYWRDHIKSEMRCYYGQFPKFVVSQKQSDDRLITISDDENQKKCYVHWNSIRSDAIYGDSDVALSMECI